MGSRIAAHFANAGFPALLLDMAQPEDHNKLARQALEGLKKSKPAALASPEFAARITIGNFDDDLAKLGDCDWVIEAVAENLDIKRALLAKVAPHLRADAILTTNTSGLPVGAIAEALPKQLRGRWFGTHFFNPPRYMQLVEVIATPESDPDAVAAVGRFVEIFLGKSVVPANDRPNFIANRIGAFAMLNTIRVMREQGLTIEEVDALTGKPLGWPRTGTFRLADMVGLDVLGSVVRNFAANAKDERADVQTPAFLEQMLERKWLGDKTGQGFYKKQKGGDGSAGGSEDARLVLDVTTLEYRPPQKAKLPALDLAKSIESLPERIRALLGANPEKDKAAAFYWAILPDLWLYAANRIGEISDSVADIDRAMRTGFNWESGPFEMWDAAGVAETSAKVRAQGRELPPALESLLAHDGAGWYRNEGAEYFDARIGEYVPVEAPTAVVTLARVKRSGGVVGENPGASLIDVGDGIGCIEFHTKMNALGGDIVNFVRQTLAPQGDVVQNFRGFVITNDATNFSAGANLVQLLLAAQDEEWDEIDLYIKAFQEMTQAIKFCPSPVVVAPFGLALGGGAEVTLHGAARQPHLELYMGLVETGVGLIPAGGGCKEMTLRALELAAGAAPAGSRSDSVELHHAMRTVFENIALAKVSTSAYEAGDLRMLRPSDGITMNRERVLHDAKERVTAMAEAGYRPPLPVTDIPAPGESVLAALKLGVYMLRQGEYASDHDVTVATHLAEILCGGKVTPGTPVSEQYLLDLEREHFLSLCGERKTQERIGHTLKTGKPLRN